MKRLLPSWPSLLLTMAITSVSPRCLHAAALTITPPAITNDYAGKIALNITGLTSGQAVRIQCFYDLNTNGVVDPGEFALRSFKVTDGQLPIIGGITNLNVPGDMDGVTNNQILVLLDFPGLDNVLDSATGKFIYEVFDAQTGAPLATNTFSVAQKVLSQGVRGRLTAAAGGFPLTNLPVALSANGGPGGTMTVTDTNGNFTIYAQPGSYSVVAVIPGFVSDQGAGFVAVASNQFVTNNLALASASYYVAGRLTDAANSNKGIGGVFIQAQTTNNLFAGGFTDTNGNFAVLVSPNQWKIDPSQEGLAEHGYLGLQNKLTANVVSANVSNFNFSLPKADALVYGTLTDVLGHPVAGISFSANDSNNTYRPAGLSQTNGFYTIGVLAGNWNVYPDNDSLAGRGYLAGNGTNVTVGSNQAVRADFVAQKVSCYLAGRALDNLGNPLVNIGVSANNNNGGNSYVQTDNNGNYAIGVFGGSWNLNLDNQGLSQFGLVGPQFSFNVTDGVSISNIVLVAQPAPYTISGSVLDQASNAVSGLYVFGNITLNGTNYSSSANTDSNGNYSFAVFNGNWQVSLDCYGLGQRGFTCPGSQGVNITGANGFASFTLSAGQPPVLLVGTTSLSDAVVSAFYSFSLGAMGGSPPYNWSLSPGSVNLPNGLSLSSFGVLSGTPSTNGTFYFVVRVTDNAFNTDDQSLGLTILPRPTISGARRLSGTQFQFNASGAPGLPSYTFQYSTNLANWTTFLVTNAPNGPFQVTDPFATNKLRFYRIQMHP